VESSIEQQLHESTHFSDDVRQHQRGRARWRTKNSKAMKANYKVSVSAITFDSFAHSRSSSQIYVVLCINKETLYSLPTEMPCLVLWATGYLCLIW